MPSSITKSIKPVISSFSKRYILDTSVLVYHPSAFLNFPDSEVVIPLTVLSELDKLKTKDDDAGKNARQAIRLLDSLGGNLSSGVALKNKATLRVDLSENLHTMLSKIVGNEKPSGDDRILSCALRYTNKVAKKISTTLVSRDINLRVRAKAFNLSAEDYSETCVGSTGELFKGFREIKDSDLANSLRSNKEIALPKKLQDLALNEFVLISEKDGKVSAIARRVLGNKLRTLNSYTPWNLTTRSREQAMAVDLLMDPELSLVTLIGKAGCGKTVLSLACCLELLINRKQFDRVMIYRPIQEVGASLGYLPGMAEQKIAPYMEAISDALNFLTDAKLRDKDKKFTPWQMKLGQYSDRIELHAVNFLRGRTLPKSLILIDEAQNFTKHELKTLLTRVGEGSKILLTGDVSQIDAPKLNALDNGLSYVIEKFRESEMSGHLTLQKGERSRLATLAAEIL